MPHALVRRAAVSVACLLVATAAAQQAPPRGNVNGVVEQPVVEKILACIDFEESALALAEGGGRRPLDSSVAGEVTSLLEQSSTCLDEASALAQAARTNSARHTTTRAEEADGSLLGAKVADAQALEKLADGKRADKIAAKIRDAIERKYQAKLAMQGQDASPAAAQADRATRIAPEVPRDSQSHAFDRPKGPPANWQQERDNGIARGSTPRSGPSRKSAKKEPPDSYLAFRATKGTKSGGFAVLTANRDLVGPFEARVTAGGFSTNAKQRAAVGDAFACMEFDVKGSSPLEFVTICARPLPVSSMQVFVSSAAGSLGQITLQGTDFAVLDVVYDGTTFHLRAKKRSDANFTEVASFTRPQGADVWTVSLGGAQLGGNAEVGMDDFAVWAIDGD